MFRVTSPDTCYTLRHGGRAEGSGNNTKQPNQLREVTKWLKRYDKEISFHIIEQLISNNCWITMWCSA